MTIYESKHADVTLARGADDWSLWFFNAPEEGQCLSVECIPSNSSSVTISINDMALAKAWINEAYRLGFTPGERR